MFSSKEKNQVKKQVKKRVMEINVVAKKTSIVGDIKSEGDFRVDGTLEGTLKTLGQKLQKPYKEKMNEGAWDDEKRKALKKLQTSKVITKMTDMNQDLRLETTEIVTMAVEKYCSVGQYEVC